ncbi:MULTISPECIES: metallophosphoesterase family protein [unclassified Rhizobium]|uniref:metallophosphoesterase family protein n=1 Tax=unclassified Rhizobium TaxID=2613769 RepID=UPI000B32C0D8|nr:MULTISPECIES: metallophosphoesterase [unclassified Rhizobium]
MRRVRILQIGDIHYPDWRLHQSNLDAKDRQFAPGITDGLRRSSFPAILRKIGQLSTGPSCHGVVFVGDFTTAGRSEYLEGVFRHFTLLCRRNGKEIETPLLFVPGNHDVNRADARDLGRLEKFRAMAQLAAKYHWEKVPSEQPVQVKLTGKDCSLNLILLNTAVGSWELHNLPEFLRDKLQAADTHTAALDLGSLPGAEVDPSAAPTIPPAKLVEQYYGQLDTPYVMPQMLDAVQRTLDEGDATFGVLVGHHNLLPQKIPRISPYGEMLNAGFVRSQILGLNRPIVYLHGHIHQDPVEVVSDPRLPDSKLVLISAPEIKDGFNEIVFYISEHDDLVGIRLIPHRARSEDGTLVEAAHCFISTISPSRANIDSKIYELFRRLKQYKEERSGDLLFWNEVQDLAGFDFQGEALEDALIMLHASHWIEIDDLNRPNKSWRIRVKGN